LRIKTGLKFATFLPEPNFPMGYDLPDRVAIFPEIILISTLGRLKLM